ncbi:MAG: sigma-70 family RNA polymerase sigma factor, partial [Clostridia bacterium]|nr:sigma-70 family RNA polymerase sigma factor [Clostridia bacterium]
MLRSESLSLTRSPSDRWGDFEEQVKIYEKPLYHFAYRLTGDINDAQDLLQEGLLKAYRSYHRFQPGTAFDRWMFQILYRLFIDNYRKKRRRPFVSSLDEPHPQLEQAKTTDVPDY